MASIEAPWTEEQIEGLQAWQNSGVFHSYTCGSEKHNEHHDLIPTKQGWVCPVTWCTYFQTWAHDFSMDKEVIEAYATQIPHS